MSRRLAPGAEVDPSGVETYGLADRPSKVRAADFRPPYRPGGSFRAFLASLPPFLQAEDLAALAAAVARAHREGRVVALGLGAHNLKVGLQPLYTDLMERGLLTSVALNGAGIVHDFELAFAGHSSEDVGAQLEGGRFGMARETGEWLNRVVRDGHRRGLGLGQAVGEAIWEEGLPHRERSLLAAAYRRGVVATVHVAIGTDIVHMHPEADGEAIGGASLRDFRRFCAVVAELEGGVYLNVGSAVVLPEVFLKALTLVRNLGHEVRQFTTANLDFIRHYRPAVNVVGRPTGGGGRGFQLTGPHELLVPLLFGSVLEELGG
ncbi:MAG: GSU2086 family protein [Deferrisomatales bacterium]